MAVLWFDGPGFNQTIRNTVKATESKLVILETCHAMILNPMGSYAFSN